jgi:phage terminase large subunit-like protein
MSDIVVPGWPPRWATPPPSGYGSRGKEAADFIERYCRCPTDSQGGRAGELLHLRAWQQQLLTDMLTIGPDGLLWFRTILVGLPRKNAKSTLMSAVVLYRLFTEAAGAELYSVAGDRGQARRVFDAARSMVRSDPELSELAIIRQNSIEVRATGATYTVLSADAGLQEGKSPVFTVADEVAHWPAGGEAMWTTMQTAGAARREPQLVAITTAGPRVDSLGRDTTAYRLYQHGVEVARGLVEDERFGFWWYEPLAGNEADHRDPEVWAESNPGIGDLLSADVLRSELSSVSESAFRTRHCNSWTVSHNALFPWGVVEDAGDSSVVIERGERVYLGFDGSKGTVDSTALAAVSATGKPHRLVPLGRWRRPPGVIDYEVPRDEVMERIRWAARHFTVVQLVVDEYLWIEPLSQLQRELHLVVVRIPAQGTHMERATSAIYEGITSGDLIHNGDPDLVGDLSNVVARATPSGGQRMSKESKWSGRSIDMAVAAALAYSQCAGKGPGAGAGWQQYWRDEIARQQTQQDQPSPDTSSISSTVAQPQVEVAAPSSPPTPRDYILGPGVAFPSRPSACQHRWHRESWGTYCVLCSEKGEKPQEARPA